MSFEIDFRLRSGLLRALVRASVRSVEGSIAHWRAIADEVRRVRPRGLLVVADIPGEPMDPQQQPRFFAAISGAGLEGLPLAFVDQRAAHTRRTETAEILAVEHGFNARVFGDEYSAELWLRYGDG